MNLFRKAGSISDLFGGWRTFKGVWYWLLPALLVGVILRALLMLESPYAFVHVDTVDLLTTAERVFEGRPPTIHGKKTFLVPLIYTLIALLPMSALPVIAGLQHFLGLLSVCAVGLCARILFVRWRLWCLALSLVMAVHPAFLWYEHCAMPESWAVLGICLSAFGICWYVREPKRLSLLAAAGGLVLFAASRPEGQLLWPALVAAVFYVNRTHQRKWRKVLISIAVGFVVMMLTRTRQSGMLLLSSLIVHAPDEFWSKPEVSTSLIPIRNIARDGAEFLPGDRLVRIRRDLRNALISHYIEQGMQTRQAQRKAESLAFNLALEIALRNPHKLPGWAIFRVWATANENMEGPFSGERALNNQLRAIRSWESRCNNLPLLTGLLFGEELKESESLENLLRSKIHMEGPGLFQSWQHNFYSSGKFFHFPGIVGETQDLPPLPVIWAVAAAGFIAGLFKPQTRPFVLCFGLGLVVLFFATFLAANVRPRFRLIFEPMWWLFAAVFCGALWEFFQRPSLFQRLRKSSGKTLARLKGYLILGIFSRSPGCQTPGIGPYPTNLEPPVPSALRPLALRGSIKSNTLEPC